MFEMINNLIENNENKEIKLTRRQRRQEKTIHPEQKRELYKIFNQGLRSIASSKLKKYGYESTENEINVIIFIWFNEYLNEGGTFLNVPDVLKNRK